MRILYVNACVRGEASRTKQLAETFLQTFCLARPDTEIIRHDLPEMGLRPYSMDMLAHREQLCDARDWTDAALQPAMDFCHADLVLIAAPYWDLSFPSCLKVWVEHMWVRNLTFFYRADQPVGLCTAKHTVYITTSGSPIGALDLGTDYIRHVMRTLGIGGFSRLSAEALDLDTSDADAIMRKAERDVRAEAERLAAVI